MSERLQAWVNGRLVGANEPALAVTDRGFQLGDGAFETLRVRRGVPIELDLHLRRLRDGLNVLQIPMPLGDEELAAAIRAAVEANAPDDAAVRVTVSRGEPLGRGLLPVGWSTLQPTVVVQAWPHHGAPPSLAAEGLRLVTSVARRDPTHPLASVKTTSRADHVLAKLEALHAGADDTLVLTIDGHVAEATTANIAAVVTEPDGTSAMVTPPISAGILPGTTRDWLLSPAGAAALGLPAGEALLTPEALVAAPEVLLCSSVAGFVAVVAIDGRPVGDGRPGPWVARLREARETWILTQAGG